MDQGGRWENFGRKIYKRKGKESYSRIAEECLPSEEGASQEIPAFEGARE
jgi:hypothetical protein